MQTILGSGGSIGVELAKALPAYTESIRLVSRNPERVNDTDVLMKGDLTNEEDVMNAVEGSDVAYLTVGLPYSTKSWEVLWPRVMTNVINACEKQNTKLVFFDNIYMYDPAYVNRMDENTPINPSKKKERCVRGSRR